MQLSNAVNLEKICIPPPFLFPGNLPQFPGMTRKTDFLITALIDIFSPPINFSLIRQNRKSMGSSTDLLRVPI